MEMQGKIVLKGSKDVTPEKVLEAEMYLNDAVANEMFRRFGLSIRVHIEE